MQTLTQKNELERESKKISVVLKIPLHNDMSGVVMSILSLMVKVLFVKKFLKSLLVKVKRMLG